MKKIELCIASFVDVYPIIEREGKIYLCVKMTDEQITYTRLALVKLETSNQEMRKPHE